MRDQKRLCRGVGGRRISDECTSIAIRSRAEVCHRVLPEQGQVLNRRTAGDGQRAAGIGAGGQLRPGKIGRPAGKAEATEVNSVAVFPALTLPVNRIPQRMNAIA